MVTLNDIAEYIVIFIASFASRFSITETQAYNYLRKYDAIKLVHEFYDVMHTQSFEDMTESIAIYCRRKGGDL